MFDPFSCFSCHSLKSRLCYYQKCEICCILRVSTLARACTRFSVSRLQGSQHKCISPNPNSLLSAKNTQEWSHSSAPALTETPFQNTPPCRSTQCRGGFSALLSTVRWHGARCHCHQCPSGDPAALQDLHLYRGTKPPPPSPLWWYCRFCEASRY